MKNFNQLVALKEALMFAIVEKKARGTQEV
jgi:hypothetical protein